MGSMPLSEIVALHAKKVIPVLPEHRGLAFLLNDLPISGASDLFLYERTRGIWSRIPETKNPKYAFATYAGIVKEVYKIYSWVPAGTKYFTRSTEELREKKVSGKNLLGALLQTKYERGI